MNNSEKKFKPDKLYFSDNEGYLFFYSVTENKIIKELGQPMLGLISAMTKSSDTKFLYIADNYGYIKKIDTEDQRVIRDFGKIHNCVIKSIDIDSTDNFIFSSDYKGIMKCIDVNTGKIVTDFEAIHPGYIQSIVTAGANKGKFWFGEELDSQFEYDPKGELKFKELAQYLEHRKIEIEIYNNSEKTIKPKKIDIKGEIINDNLEEDDKLKNIISPGHQKYLIATSTDHAWLFVDLDESNIHKKTKEGSLFAFRPYKSLHENTKVKIFINPDLTADYGPEYQFTSDCFGHFKQWNVNDRSLAKDHGQVHMGTILCMKVSHDVENIFTAGEDKVIKQFSVRNKELVKNYGEVSRYPICSMEVTSDNDYLFTCDNAGYVKMYDIKHYMRQYKNQGKVNDVGINSVWVDHNYNQMFFSGVLGKIKAFSIESGKIEQDNGVVSEDGIYCLCNLDEKHF